MIEYIEHHIVDQCNLNCKGCSHFSQLAPDWFESIDEFKEHFGALAYVTGSQIGTIRIMGGEPLLHPDVSILLAICRTYFPRTIIELVSNGLLLKKRKEELLLVCNELKIVMCVSDYGLFNVDEVLQGFHYIKRSPKEVGMYNLCIDPTGSQPIQTAFQNCDMHVNHWYFFQRGRIYPCCFAGNIRFFNKYFKDQLEQPIWTDVDDVSIDIYEHSMDEINDFCNTPHNLCKFCNSTKRHETEHLFDKTKKEITEWICP